MRRRAAKLMDADAEAYLAFVEARRAAKGMEPAARERATRRARDRTVDVPLAIVQLAAQVVELATTLAVSGNPNLRSDAVTAALLAAASAQAGAVTLAANVDAAAGDGRLDEARRLARAASARVRSLTPRGRAGARGRVPT